jgi:hypothetical protein
VPILIRLNNDVASHHSLDHASRIFSVANFAEGIRRSLLLHSNIFNSVIDQINELRFPQTRSAFSSTQIFRPRSINRDNPNIRIKTKQVNRQKLAPFFLPQSVLVLGSCPADRQLAVKPAHTKTAKLEFATTGNEPAFPKSQLISINLRFTMILGPLRRILNAFYKLTFPAEWIRSEIRSANNCPAEGNPKIGSTSSGQQAKKLKTAGETKQKRAQVIRKTVVSELSQLP